jgi:ribonuclease BN (tRNA processing enzyme)
VLIRFYGTRGSLPTPGPSTVRYGGNTSCVLVRSNSGTLVVLDAGTGAAVLGRELAANGELSGHILIGHTHWDHIQGFPFFEPIFRAGGEWDVYAPRGFQYTLRDILGGQMQCTYFPVELGQLPAAIRYHELIEGEFRVGDIRVTTRYLNHTALTLGYRLECDGATIAYSCDHEPHSRAFAGGSPAGLSDHDRAHAAFFDGADLLIHDAQYLASEYPGKVSWGHSTVEYAVAVARLAKVKRLALTHHDPTRTDVAIDAIGERVRGQTDSAALEIFAAAEGQEIRLVGTSVGAAGVAASATSDIGPALAESRALLAMATPGKAKMLTDILMSDGVAVSTAAIDRAETVAARIHPSVVVLEDSDAVDIAALADRLRRSGGADTPVVLVTAREDDGVLAAGGFADRLVEPVSPSYAQARVRAAILRRVSRWQRAKMPEDEDNRLSELKRRRLLDTPPEERLDRITRMAAAGFDVPIALITLLDAQRQWFKSRCGLEMREGAREESFCAHAIVGRDVFVVPDALVDDRFAENPLVSGPPGIRFYAGQPLILSGGTCIGTLCIIDRRPRDLDLQRLALLKDLADLAVEELERAHPPGAESDPDA